MNSQGREALEAALNRELQGSRCHILAGAHRGETGDFVRIHGESFLCDVVLLGGEIVCDALCAIIGMTAPSSMFAD